MRLARRLERDVRERGRSTASVHAQFANHVEPMQRAFVDRPAPPPISCSISALGATLADASDLLLSACEALASQAP